MKKLVRDNIQCNSSTEGRTVCLYGDKIEGEIAHNKEAHLHFLKLKLIEEAKEAQAATNLLGLYDELGDILEVIQAMCECGFVDLDKMWKMKEQKRATRGSFVKGIILETRE